MNENERADDPRLLSLAASISAGTPVDWRAERDRIADPERSATLDELQALERLSRVNDPTPMTWGPFTIADEIGRGAFGTVYRAMDPNLQVDLALKVIRPPSADEPIDTARALREARLLAQISHPNVVRVYRADRVENEVGVAMELIKGRTLEDIVEREGAYGANEALLVGRDLCRALAAVHAAGLLHGDIKARNVMRAEGGRIVLMDFGGGRDLKREPSQADSISGTPLYLAPEVFAGQDATKTADIYSLGVLIYFLATGTYPIEGSSFADIERQHRQYAPRRPLRDIRPDLTEAFTQVVERATSARPSHRYASASEFESAIDRALRGVVDPMAPPVDWRRVATAAAIVGALGLVSTATYRALFPSNDTSSASRPGTGNTVTPSADGSALPISPGDGSYVIDAALHRIENGADVRLQSGARVAPGDRLSLDVRASVPTYVYVVNEDEQGESYLLFPLPGQGLTNPLPAGARHRLPGAQDGEQIHWQVTSAGGREHFLIFAAPEPPSPAFVRMFAALPTPSAGKPVVSHRLSTQEVAVLRGVGGLQSSPMSTDQQLRLTKEFGTALSASEEVVRGIWVRQVTLENPGRR